MTAENYLLLLEEYDYQTPPEVARDAAQAIQQAMVASDVFTTFVYRPGGVALGNVFTSWAALYAALNVAAPTSANGTRSPTTILVDDSFVSPAVIPPDAYNFDQVTFLSESNLASASIGAGANLNLAIGVTLLSPTVGLTLTFGGGIQVTYLDATPCLTSVAGVARIYLHDSATLQCSGAGVFLNVTGGAGLVEGDKAGSIGDGIHAVASYVAPGVLVVRAYANTTVAAAAIAGGASATVNWDSHIPGAQGAGVVLSQKNGYVPAVAGNWNPAPTSQSQALDILAAVAKNHVQGIQAFGAPAMAITTANLAHTTATGHTRCFASVSVSSSGAGDDVGFQLNIDGVPTGPVMGVSGTAIGDALSCAIQYDFAPAAGAHQYTVTATSGSGVNLTGIQAIVQVQELLS